MAIFGRRRPSKEAVNAVVNRRVADQLAKASTSPGTPIGDIASYQHTLSQAVARGPGGGNIPDPTRAAMQQQGMDATAAFAPGAPIAPYEPVGSPPRTYNFRTGQNISTRPRTGSGRISFDTLKQIVGTYDIAQICGNHRIDDIRSLDWAVVPIKGIEGDVTSELTAARAAVEKPDGRTPFASWLRKYLYDTVHFDAGCLYKQRDMKGDVIGLKVVDGTTFAPLLDYLGDLPTDDAPAYAQFANGVPWGWFPDQDVVYAPFWPQSDSAYGMPPLEWLLLNANTDLRFQYYFLKTFTDGNIPQQWMKAPPDQNSPAQIEEWQNHFDAWLTGDEAKKHQVVWVPAGSEPSAINQVTFDSEFPLYLLRRPCAAYGVTPTDLGFTDDANRATADAQIDVQFRIGTKPLIRHVEGILNSYLHDDRGFTRVEFTLDQGQEKEDRLSEAQAWQIYVEMGAASPDEPRSTVLGLPVDPANPVPRTMTTRTGLVPVKSIIEVSGKIDPETGGPEPGTVTISDAPGFNPPVPIDSPIIPQTNPDGPPVASASGDPAAAGEPVAKDTDGPIAKKYDPMQPRDDHGKWGGLGSATAFVASAIGVKTKSAKDHDADFQSGADKAEKDAATHLERSGDDTSLIHSNFADEMDAAKTAQGKGQTKAAARHLGAATALETTLKQHGEKPRYGTTTVSKETTAGVTAATGIEGVDLKGKKKAKSDDDEDDDEEELGKALALWRSNTRNRMRKGLPAKRFTHTAIPDTVGEELYKQLSQARTRVEVDEAFRKAAGPDSPKGVDPRQTARVALEDTVGDFYQPKLQAALAALHPGIAEAAGKFVATHTAKVAKAVGPLDDDQEALVQQALALFRQGATADTAKLEATLHAIYGDSWVAGVHSAETNGAAILDTHLAAVDVGVNWDDWKPGWAEAADVVATPGLQTLLAQADITIQGVSNTQLDRISTAVADGLRTGATQADVTATVNAIVADPAQAKAIAATETARGAETASQVAYKAAGVGKWEWLAEADACPSCQDNAAGSPYDVGSGPTIPDHPHCRCASAPIVE